MTVIRTRPRSHVHAHSGRTRSPFQPARLANHRVTASANKATTKATTRVKDNRVVKRVSNRRWTARKAAQPTKKSRASSADSRTGIHTYRASRYNSIPHARSKNSCVSDGRMRPDGSSTRTKSTRKPRSRLSVPDLNVGELKSRRKSPEKSTQPGSLVTA